MKRIIFGLLLLGICFGIEQNFSSFFDFIKYADKQANYLFLPAVLLALDISLLSLMSNKKAGIFTSGAISFVFTFGLSVIYSSPYFVGIMSIFVLQSAVGIFLHSKEVFIWKT